MYDPGVYPASGAALAGRADVAIVFATQLELEGYDSPDLSLPGGQDGLIAAVAAANPNTIVVLETGNPVAMPWRESVKAILAAWYPGEAGGQAIAEILSGEVNPSGKLPVTFPASERDLPRARIPGWGQPEGAAATIDYSEGADVGYRWFAKIGRAPLYPFGHGLSYTRFSYSALTLTGGDTVVAQFTVRNEGERAGSEVPQLYLTSRGATRTLRLLGFERVNLEPGASRKVRIVVDPRLLASFDVQAGRWKREAGPYEITLAHEAGADDEHGSVRLKGRVFGQ
jgi:beta-glucosidase